MIRALLLDADVRAEIRQLVAHAEAHPVEMPALVERIQTPTGKTEHMAQMTYQTILIPMGYLVTFSIEKAHPCGDCRHLSVSLENAPDMSLRNALPHPSAVWTIAELFGFWGRLEETSLWLEDLLGRDNKAVNVVQPLTPIPDDKPVCP